MNCRLERLRKPWEPEAVLGLVRDGEQALHGARFTDHEIFAIRLALDPSGVTPEGVQDK